jgi:hypothetical protein
VTALESTEGIDEVSVRTWGAYVSVPSDNGTSIESETSEWIEEFQEWARDDDHSLGPSFQRVERSTMVSEGSVAAIRPPVLCLAVYEGDDLVTVFPCEDEGETRTVEDCLDRLESGELLDLSTADG